MPEKSIPKKDTAIVKKPPISPSFMSKFLSYVSNLSKMNKMMDLGGNVGGAQYFTRAPGRGSGFKQNQRRERKLSRRRKMKPSAR